MKPHPFYSTSFLSQRPHILHKTLKDVHLTKVFQKLNFPNTSISLQQL